ncbi:DoxX family protein [Pseudonocardia sp. NPDC049635]|uniref:DoxX family protein n=1 Tax=Pseudonocardia sp. NPDC049635 TaxID=3155506 RepID=UPI0033D49028
MYRSLTGTPRDVVLLVGRVVLAYILMMHALNKIQAGVFDTAAVFSKFGIPLAIAAASFTIVVELVVSVSLLLGLRMVVPSALMVFVMAGAIYFVHGQNGLFMADNGWALVGVIICALLAFMVSGPGRFSADDLIAKHAERRIEQTQAIPRQTVSV